MFRVSFKNRLLLKKNFIGEKIDEKPTKKHNEFELKKKKQAIHDSFHND
jgi:hypothetical protein